MDWGLFDSKSPSKDYPFLREEIVYSSQYYYYFAIIEDLILRFGWTLSVSLTEIGVINSDLMVSILASLELFRYLIRNESLSKVSKVLIINNNCFVSRFVWNFFRLENEHLNNCGEFRAVRDISIAPIDTRDQENSVDAMISNPLVKQRKPKLLLSKKFGQNGGNFVNAANTHARFQN
jgi:hypothetical protein